MGRRSEAWGPQEIARPEPVRVTEPRARQVTHTLETVGTFLPYEAVTVKAEVGGRVRHIRRILKEEERRMG